jgi:anti-sigma factor RsiW
MRGMQCSEVYALISAYVDDEVEAEQARALASHVASCTHCAALADDYRRIGSELLANYRSAPTGLVAKLRARVLAEEDAVSFTTWNPRRFLRQAAVLLCATLLSALATWHLAQTHIADTNLAQDVVSAHIRSLLQEHTTQVASADRHAVRPWFAGRVDFAPPVKDLSAQGFSLLGGRLDLVHGRRTAVVVFRRRQHIIDVFVWPATGGEYGPRSAVHNGYNTLTWSAADMTYWAVSDLNAAELRELQALL